MNLAGYTLGVSLAIKWYIRRIKNYRPTQWSAESTPALHQMAWALAGLTFAILAFCLISALNARASWQPQLARFDCHAAISWLPQSYDRAGCWRAFQNFLALTCFFWAVRDWLPGKTMDEEHVGRQTIGGADRDENSHLPGRLRGLL